MTMLNRLAPTASPKLAWTQNQISLLDHLMNDKGAIRRKTLSHYLTKIARLGGYLARASDPPPGNTVMWRGLSPPPTSSWARYWGRKLWVIERRWLIPIEGLSVH
jgi:hypothetical protein